MDSNSQRSQPAQPAHALVHEAEALAAEQPLRANEERLRVAVEAGAIGIWDIDLRHDIRTWSDQAKAIYGLAPHEPMDYGRQLALIHPDDRARVHELVSRFRDQGTLFQLDFQHRIVRPDGAMRWVAVRGKAIYDGGPLPVRLIGTIVDISERKQIDQALVRSEKKFATAFNTGPIILTITRLADGTFAEVNESFLNTTGFTREEVLGRTPVEIGLWVVPAGRDEGLRRLRTGEPVRGVESEFRMKDGSLRTCLMSAELIEIDGEACVLTALTDITERKRAENDARFFAELAERIRVIEDADELLWAVSCAVGEYLRVGRCFFTEIDLAGGRGVVRRDYCRGMPSVAGEYPVSDYSPAAQAESMAGRTIVNCDATIDPRTAELYDQTYGPAGERAYVAVPLRREGIWRATLWASVDQPRQWLPSEVNLLETVAERTWLAVERLRLYEEAQRARAAAEAAVRVRDQFFSLAAHELNNPLAALIGHAQLLERRFKRAEGASERDLAAVQTIAGLTSRLSTLVSSMFDVSRMEMGQLQLDMAELDFAALVARIVAEMRPTLTQHRLALAGAGAPLRVRGDALRLEQAIQNLLSNAVKYSPAGGPIELQLKQAGDHALLRIRDHGIGIPAAALPQLFERFYRVPNAATQAIGGSGLGLYVVKELIALHGGDVAVASVEGQGSTFTIALPLLT